MNINYKQPQFELFPANSATLEDVNKPRFLLANLNLSIETLVIFTILGIMLWLLAFSLGVERGKHLAAQVLDERISDAWNLAPRKPALPVVSPHAIPMVQKNPGNGGYLATNRVARPMPVLAKTVPLVKVAPVQKQAVLLTGRFAVQTASYKNEAYAKDEALKLKAKGLNSFLIKKGDFWLICVGPFANVNSATAVLKKVQSKFPGSSVRRF